MAKYKLSISYEFEANDIEDMIDKAEYKLVIQDYKDAQVALLRDGDRSGANLLAPVNSSHYKHGKILLNNYIDNNKLNKNSIYYQSEEERESDEKS